MLHRKIQKTLAQKHRILIVEDEPLIAEDLSGFLEESGFDVAGIAYSYKDALNYLDTLKLNAAILDINLGDTEYDGINVGEELRSKHDIPFIYLTSYSDKEILERAKKTRPDGYLLKPFNGRDVMTSLEIALYNHLEKKNVTLNIDALNDNLPVALSNRECDLLTHLREGKTNKEIAESLSVSVNTVKTHLLHLFEKLDVSNRTQAIFKLLEFAGR